MRRTERGKTSGLMGKNFFMYKEEIIIYECALAHKEQGSPARLSAAARVS